VLNIQHDCPGFGCDTSGVKTIIQERCKTTRTKSVVSHKEDTHFLLNTSSLHNYHEIELFLSPSYPPRRIFVENHEEVRRLMATSLRDKRRQDQEAKEALERDLALGRVGVSSMTLANSDSKTTRQRLKTASDIAIPGDSNRKATQGKIVSKRGKQGAVVPPIQPVTFPPEPLLHPASSSSLVGNTGLPGPQFPEQAETVGRPSSYHQENQTISHDIMAQSSCGYQMLSPYNPASIQAPSNALIQVHNPTHELPLHPRPHMSNSFNASADGIPNSYPPFLHAPVVPSGHPHPTTLSFSQPPNNSYLSIPSNSSAYLGLNFGQPTPSYLPGPSVPSVILPGAEKGKRKRTNATAMQNENVPIDPSKPPVKRRRVTKGMKQSAESTMAALRRDLFG